MALRETASQTAGPYVHLGLVPAFAGLPGIYGRMVGDSPVRAGARGTPVTITGRVFDGAGDPVRDAVIETWQADAAGRWPGTQGADPHVPGFARIATDGGTGTFTLRTIRPGGEGAHAPHIALWILARGINIGLSTRLYFPDADTADDPVLARVPPERRDTLIARPDGPDAYRFDIRLQGAGETVFFDM